MIPLSMPRKIKALIADLKRAGFTMHSGKGSHRKFTCGRVNMSLSGKEGADAHRYQEKDVKEAIKEAKQ